MAGFSFVGGLSGTDFLETYRSLTKSSQITSQCSPRVLYKARASCWKDASESSSSAWGAVMTSSAADMLTRRHLRCVSEELSS